MPNVKLIIEYNGAAFHGWQFQPGVKTVQSELHKAVELAIREEIRCVHASGRTDAGVHARRQVVNFECQNEPDLFRLKYAISNILRGELTVLEAEIVDDRFNALRDAVRKQYSYVVYYRSTPPVLDRGRVWHVGQKLDVARMQEQASAIVGKRDFKCFQGTGCQARSTIKEVFESELIDDFPYLHYRIVGDGFMKHMVRNIVGTLVGIGRGDSRLPAIDELIESKDRRRAGVTAPPYGLFLDWVEY